MKSLVKKCRGGQRGIERRETKGRCDYLVNASINYLDFSQKILQLLCDIRKGWSHHRVFFPTRAHELISKIQKSIDKKFATDIFSILTGSISMEKDAKKWIWDACKNKIKNKIKNNIDLLNVASTLTCNEFANRYNWLNAYLWFSVLVVSSMFNLEKKWLLEDLARLVSNVEKMCYYLSNVEYKYF